LLATERRSVGRHPHSEVSIEAVSLIAEVAVGLAGFAGVAVMLGRGPGRWGAGDALRIRLLLVAAFSALFASLVAIGSDWAGLAPPDSIRAGAGVLAVGQSYWTFFLGAQIPRLEPSEQALFSSRLALLFRVVALMSIAGQIFILSGFAGGASSGLFLFGLLASLGYTALAFVRLMFIRPESE
jgi:hypothetical protein